MKYAKHNDIALVARDLYKRLFLHHDMRSESQEEPDDVTDAGPTAPKLVRTNSEKLQEFIMGRKEKSGNDSSSAIKSAANLLADIKKDMKIYEMSGQRTHSLEMVS